MAEQDDEIHTQDTDSIFDDTRMTEPAELSELPQENIDLSQFENANPIVKFFGKLSEFLLTTKEYRETKKLQEKIDEFVNENSDFLEMLNNFGCRIVYNKDHTEFICEKYNLTGKIYTETDNTLKFDDNAKKILQYMAQEIHSVTKLSDTLDEYEKNGFYPVGTPQKTEINGRTIIIGTLRNRNGDEIQIDIKTGMRISKM